MALAPVITDLPIIGLTLLFLTKLAGFNTIMGVISGLGGLVILYLGIQVIRARGIEIIPAPPKIDSLNR